MIKLKEVCKDNWEECISLKPKQEQMELIASNLYSIAEAQFLNGFSSRAIYEDDVMVGYTLFGLDQDDHNYWIYRFMIDERYQRNGYGFEAMTKLIEEIRNREDRTDIIVLGYNPENEPAKKLYMRAGFKEEGIAPWGEMIAKYKFE
ncbi:GNAT family N-acetyltransferase [Paenibacillus sp. JJ1722]|uniref:GNAT family N-acetyltransferase n=1 Tax=Paenibacillus sp. JJ1722 TaxID=3398770 RepID=UPI003AAD3940